MISHWMVSISLLIMAGGVGMAIGGWIAERKVTVDGQRVRLQQLEVEVKKPKEDIKKQAEEPVNSVDWWRKWENGMIDGYRWNRWWLISQTWDTWDMLGRRSGHVIRSSGHQWCLSDPVATGKPTWGQELIMQNAALLYGEAGNVEECGFLCLNGI
jgi:hypothetical protein